MKDFTQEQASQYRPGSGVPSTESLNAMSPAQLAGALERALDAMTEDSYDPALIDAYLDALERKAPMPEPPDTGEAFARFSHRLQTFSQYNAVADTHKKASADRGRGHSLKRAVVTLAATFALLLTLLVGAQAAGMDVFGRLAQWTDEIFFFLPSTGESAHSTQAYGAFRQALKDQGLPEEYAPSWYPEGFIAEEPKIWNDEMSTSVELPFTNEEGKFFAVSVDRYKDLSCMQASFEKDPTPVEQYTADGRTFYIMSNIDTMSAAWAGDDLMQTIIGEISVDEIKHMIHSMGG